MQSSIQKVNDLALTAGKQATARLKHVDALIMEREAKILAKLADGAIGAARVVDETVVNTKNFVSDMMPDLGFVTVDGVPKIPATNTHFFENTVKGALSKFEGLNIGGKGTGEGGNRYLKNIDGFISGNKKFNEVLDDYAVAYAEKVNSNVPWKWRSIPGGDALSQKQLKLIRERAKELGKIPDVPMKPGTKYPDFEKSDLIINIDEKVIIIQLPKEYWKKSDPAQFVWLDSQLPGRKRPPGTT